MNQDQTESAFATDDEDTAALYDHAAAASEDDEDFVPPPLTGEEDFTFTELSPEDDEGLPQEVDAFETGDDLPLVVEEGLASDELALPEEEWVLEEEPLAALPSETEDAFADVEPVAAEPLEPFVMPDNWDEYFDAMIASLPTVPAEAIWVQVQEDLNINIESLIAIY